MTPIEWGARTARMRGPVLPGQGRNANAIGAYAGGYALYRGLAQASGVLDPGHRANLANTGPAVPIGPFPAWSDRDQIVSFDPWGHRVAQDFTAEIASGLDLRPTIAVAQGRLRMGEICDAMDLGRLKADGKILNHAGDISVVKIAIEPVWWLPGISRRLGLDEAHLRQALHRSSGGMYPDLVNRPDLELFLPPIGGTSVYLFGDLSQMGKTDQLVACRMHDECNGSDVFGSDLCTCRPYLAYGVEECIAMAQAGGLGVVAYNRKEGRALGEVVKLLVYNARKSCPGGDHPDAYFDHTEQVAGVQDARFQDLSVDVLHWLGITRIERWISMSNLKHDAVTSAGIQIVRQVAIPEALVPPHADVEIEAKKAAGYFSEPA